MIDCEIHGVAGLDAPIRAKVRHFAEDWRTNTYPCGDPRRPELIRHEILHGKKNFAC